MNKSNVELDSIDAIVEDGGEGFDNPTYEEGTSVEGWKYRVDEPQEKPADELRESKVRIDVPKSEPIPKKSCWQTMEFDDLYIRKHWDGRLKLLELAGTAGVAICLPDNDHLYQPRFILFRAIGVIALIFVVNDLFLHLFSLWMHLPRFFRYKTLHMLLTAIASICFLVGSCLIVVVAKEIPNESLTLFASFFGFVTMILFAIESVLHLLRAKAEMPYVANVEY